MSHAIKLSAFLVANQLDKKEIKIIEDNLRVFREIINQRESSLLEWIIILLILVEVFDPAHHKAAQV